MKKILMTIALTAGLALPALARPHKGPPPPHVMIAEQADDAGLSAATVEAVEAVAEAREDAIRALHDEARGAREALREIVADPFSDPAEALAAVDALAAAERALERAKIEVLLEIKALMTPAQWEALDFEGPSERGEGPPKGGPPRHGR